MANRDSQSPIDFAVESVSDSATATTCKVDSILVCGGTSSEPILKELKGAVNVVNTHTKSLAEDISLLQQAGGQRDEVIDRISMAQSKIQFTLSDEISPRLDQLETRIVDLATKLETMQDSFTAMLEKTMNDAEECDISQPIMRGRTRALSTDRRAYKHRSASMSSTASSGFGSTIGENVNLGDVEEDDEDTKY